MRRAHYRCRMVSITSLILEVADTAAASRFYADAFGAPVPLPWMDYWRVKAGVYWDLATSQWLELQGGLYYDDGYLSYGANVIRTGPTASTANDTRFLFSFRLRGPDGADFAL